MMELFVQDPGALKAAGMANQTALVELQGNMKAVMNWHTVSRHHFPGLRLVRHVFGSHIQKLAGRQI